MTINVDGPREWSPRPEEEILRKQKSIMLAADGCWEDIIDVHLKAIDHAKSCDRCLKLLLEAARKAVALEKKP